MARVNKSAKQEIGIGSYLAWGHLADDTEVGVIVRATATRWIVQPLKPGSAEVQITRSGLRRIPVGNQIGDNFDRARAKLTTSKAVQTAIEDRELRERLYKSASAIAKAANEFASRCSGVFGQEIAGSQGDIRDALTWLAEAQMIVERVQALDIKRTPIPVKISRWR